MIADEDALNYLKENHVNLYSEASAFDGTHGIMAYNRSLQISGKSTKIKPMDEWICSVGKHQGIIPGKTWIKVQQCLSQNKSKAFRKPRSNVALLSGLLRCGNCGEYMRPKKSSRVNAKGEFIYSYLCNLKERSGLQCCNMKNVNGNILDETIIEQIKSLSEDGSEFLSLLEKSKKSLISDKAGYEDQIRKLEGNITENKNAITNLVTTLSKATGSTAESYLLQQITELDQKNNELNKKLDDLKKLSQEKNLSDAEFDVLADMLSSFKDTVDDMTIEQKRAAIRAFVKQVIWDGEKIHVILFGSDYDYPFPKVSVDKSGSSEESDAPDDVITTPVEPLGENSK